MISKIKFKIVWNWYGRISRIESSLNLWFSACQSKRTIRKISWLTSCRRKGRKRCQNDCQTGLGRQSNGKCSWSTSRWWTYTRRFQGFLHSLARERGVKNCKRWDQRYFTMWRSRWRKSCQNRRRYPVANLEQMPYQHDVHAFGLTKRWADYAVLLCW